MMAPDPCAIRLRLLANGYEPHPANGKAIHVSGWSEGEITKARLAEIEVSYPDHKNTGLRTGRLVGVDIDLTNAAHTVEIEQVIASVLGPSDYVRHGKKGALIGYRNETPISKITVGVQKKRFVEFLGVGQHFVAYGIHPDTKQPYDWPNEYLGADPLQTPLADLPEVTPEQLYEAARAVAAKLKSLGYGEVSVKGIKSGSVDAPSTATGAPVDPAKLREAASFLDPNSAYDEWRDIVAGIGSANCPEAPQIAHEWCEGKLDRLGRYRNTLPSKYTGREAVDLVLDTMPAKEGGISVGTIAKQAHDAGWTGRLDPRPDYSEAIRNLSSNHAEPALGIWRSYFGPEISLITPPRWLIKKTVPTPGVGIIFGKFGSFKTSAALGIADGVIIGGKVFDRFDTEQGDVVLVAGEGLSGLKNRVEAQVKHHGRALDAYRLLIVPKVPHADQAGDWIALTRTIEARGVTPRIILFDHLSIMLAGQDQNDATVATQAMQMLQELSAHFKCTVLCIAHAGKDGEREVRGSSAFLDNVDFAYELTRTEGSDFVKVRCAKMRDGDAPEPFHLRAVACHGAIRMTIADRDDARRAEGKQVGLRPTEVAAILHMLGACPGGANAWTGERGGVPSRTLAAEIVRSRHLAENDGLEPSPKEIDVMVALLNRGAKDDRFQALVVRENPRQWAIAPGPISMGADHV